MLASLSTRGNLNACFEQLVNLVCFVSTAKVDSNAFSLQDLSVGRVDLVAAVKLNELGLVADCLLDVLQGVGLPLHVADLDLRIHQSGGGGGRSAAGQEGLMQSLVGRNSLRCLLSQVDTSFEVNVEPDVFRHDSQRFVERRDGRVFELASLPGTGIQFLQFGKG